MGCDFFWNAKEEDVFRQRKVGWFLESLFDADDTGVSSCFNRAWRCQTFNGYYTGYFLDSDNSRKVNESTTLQLIGTTIYCREMDEMQFSFVFNNTSYDAPELITLKIISSLSKPEYEGVRDYLPDVKDNDPNSFIAIYNKGSYHRMIANEEWLAMLLYSIKDQFLPKLNATDDYLYFEDIIKSELPVPPAFSDTICKPLLAAKWGFEYSELLNNSSD